jgi:hypothetical protein
MSSTTDPSTHTRTYIRSFVIKPLLAKDVNLPTAAKQLCKSDEQIALSISLAHINKDGDVVDETRVRSDTSALESNDGVYQWAADEAMRIPCPASWDGESSYNVHLRLYVEKIDGQVSVSGLVIYIFLCIDVYLSKEDGVNVFFLSFFLRCVLCAHAIGLSALPHTHCGGVSDVNEYAHDLHRRLAPKLQPTPGMSPGACARA